MHGRGTRRVGPDPTPPGSAILRRGASHGPRRPVTTRSLVPALLLLSACAGGAESTSLSAGSSPASDPTAVTTSGASEGAPTGTGSDMGLATTGATPVCGNGTVEGDKQCDDGNADDDDTCTVTCTAAACGDGVIQPPEQCDDGNLEDTDTCSSACKASACGDGVIQPPESCDDGNLADSDTCTSTCAAAACGDGFTQPGEACDDGNKIDDDDCTNACALASCGDGAPQPGEACDDGNMVDTDACLGTCLVAACGDGVVQAGVDECDDGNASNADTCTVACKLPTCTDALKSGAESDVDCGGGTCNDCNKGKGCAADTDCVTGACVNGACNLPTSCGQLKTGLPATPTGVYTLDTDGDGPRQPFDVYCDMVTDGGGWTLAGRSRNTPSAPGCAPSDGLDGFGWRTATGSLADDGNAYSLDVAGHGLQFTQVLFGDHAGGKSFAGNVFRHTVQANFIDVHINSHYAIGTPATVAGPCPGASMFGWIGFTGNTNSFHFRDVDGNDFGLFLSGWRACYDDCTGGNINGLPGLLFVR